MPGDSWYRPGWEELSPAELVVLAWNIGAPMARSARQARVWNEWPALAYALDRLTVAQEGKLPSGSR